MYFNVLEGNEPRRVELAFGKASDMANLKKWRLPAKLEGNEPCRDALEFARLATKRWRYYGKTSQVIESIAAIRNITSRIPHDEVAFILVARVKWFKSSSILGLALCRRTWCGHIYLDFLSVHPSIVGKMEPRIRGIGAGMLYGLCEIAGQCGSPVIWGETTGSSVSFYRKAIGDTAMLDHLSITGRGLDNCRREFQKIRIQ